MCCKATGKKAGATRRCGTVVLPASSEVGSQGRAHASLLRAVRAQGPGVRVSSNSYSLAIHVAPAHHHIPRSPERIHSEAAHSSNPIHSRPPRSHTLPGLPRFDFPHPFDRRAHDQLNGKQLPRVRASQRIRTHTRTRAGSRLPYRGPSGWGSWPHTYESALSSKIGTLHGIPPREPSAPPGDPWRPGTRSMRLGNSTGCRRWRHSARALPANSRHPRDFE